jgi:phosphohistidine phosphatase
MLVSSAQRTKETCERLMLEAEIAILDALYLASPGTMLGVLKRASGQCVLMLGHNPGTAWLARDLVARAPEHPRFSDYPTCATLIVDFAIENWGELKPGSGTVIKFITPRELIG